LLRPRGVDSCRAWRGIVCRGASFERLTVECLNEDDGDPALALRTERRYVGNFIRHAPAIVSFFLSTFW
jgi:hypothetical protein